MEAPLTEDPQPQEYVEPTTPTEKAVATLAVQLFKIHTGKDGGGRIQFDFGADALDEIQKIQKANGVGGVNFYLVVMPDHMVTRQPDTY